MLGRRSSASAGQRRHLVAVLPDQPRTTDRVRDRHTSTSTASRTRRSTRSSTGLPKEPFYDQVYEWFPGRTYDERPDRRRRQRDRRRARAGPGRGACRRGRDRPGDPGRSAPTSTPIIPTTDPRVTVHINDGRAFLSELDRPKYDLVIFALPDSLTLVSRRRRTSASSRSCSPRRRSGASRDHLAPERRVRPVQLLPRAVARGQARHDAPGRLRHAAAPAAVRRRPGGPGGRSRGRRPGRRSATRATGSIRCRPSGVPDPRPATDDWPFLYLRVPDVAPYYLAALAFVLVFAAHRRGRGGPRDATPRSAGSARTSSCWAWPSCCSRPGASSASACCSGRPGSSTRWRSSRSWRSVLLAILVNCALADPQAGTPLRGPVRGPRGRLPRARPTSLLIDPPALRYGLAGRRRVRAGLLRQPRLHLLVPRHEDRRHVVRLATSSARWSAASSSTWRC